MIAQREGGSPVQDIVLATSHARLSICALLRAARHLPSGQNPEHKKPPGRPSKLSSSILKFMRLEFTRSPFMTPFELKKYHPDLFSGVSVRSIQHHAMRSLNMPARKAAKKPLITTKMKKKRLAFALKYRH